MKIELLSVGRPRERDAISLHDRYATRIAKFGVGYRTRWVADVAAGGRYSAEHARSREARRLLDLWDGKGTLVALDPAGRRFTSEKLAAELERWSMPRLVLVVGGPTGLHGSVRDAAHLSWSLSDLTLPHELVRVVVAEQIYRSLTLMRGVPYHK